MVLHRKLQGQLLFLRILHREVVDIAKKIIIVLVEISLGSSFELEIQLLIAQAVNFRDNEIRNEMLTDIYEEQKMLISFMNKLNK